MVDVSIIMPVFNEDKYLCRSINSVINQSITSKELICVNDGSTDDSLEILKKYAEKYDFIKVINQKHMGVGHARNEGLKESSGVYVSFLDADDEFLNKIALETMFDVAVRNDADIVSSNIKRKDEKGKITIDTNYLKNYYNYFPNNTIITSKDYGIAGAFYKNIYKKSFLEKNNILFSNLKKGSDMLFLTNVLTSVESIPVINKNLYAYHYQAKGFSEYNIDTYDEKYDYIKIFKMIFDILLNKNENVSFENYKRVFLDYLLYGQNIYDDDLRDILSKIFPNIDDYFKADEDAYLYIQGFFMRRSLNDKGSSSFSDLKHDLFCRTVGCDELTFHDMNRYMQLSGTGGDNQLLDSMLGLKSYEFKLDNEYLKLTQKIDEISRKNDVLERSNDKILSSKSWKMTESFRKVKRLIK